MLLAPCGPTPDDDHAIVARYDCLGVPISINDHEYPLHPSLFAYSSISSPGILHGWRHIYYKGSRIPPSHRPSDPYLTGDDSPAPLSDAHDHLHRDLRGRFETPARPLGSLGVPSYSPRSRQYDSLESVVSQDQPSSNTRASGHPLSPSGSKLMPADSRRIDNRLAERTSHLALRHPSLFEQVSRVRQVFSIEPSRSGLPSPKLGRTFQTRRFFTFSTILSAIPTFPRGPVGRPVPFARRCRLLNTSIGPVGRRKSLAGQLRSVLGSGWGISLITGQNKAISALGRSRSLPLRLFLALCRRWYLSRSKPHHLTKASYYSCTHTPGYI